MQVKSGSEIRLRVLLKNASDREILVARTVAGLDHGEFDYGVEVRDEKGIKVPHTKYGRDMDHDERGGASGSVIMTPLRRGTPVTMSSLRTYAT
jgi:hypothetical protein